MSILLSDIECVDNRSRDNTAIKELAENIGALGLVNPVTLQRTEGGGKLYKVIAGRRRFRALQLLERREVFEGEYRIIDADADMVAFCENFHRSQLTIHEELEQLQLLSNKYGSDKIAFFAKELGKSEAWVRTRVRLLNLSPKWQKQLENGSLPLSHLEEVGKYPPEVQERIPEYQVFNFRNSADAAKNLKAYLMIRLPKKHWSECDNCPNNPATDTFFFADTPASCTDHDCLMHKLGDDLEPVLKEFQEKKMPVYLANDFSFWQARDYINKRFNCDCSTNFEKHAKGSDNIIILHDTHFTSCKGRVREYDKKNVLFAPESKNKSAGVPASDPAEQLKNLTAKLTGKRYANAICNFLAFLDNTDSCVPECLLRFADKEKQIRLLLLKYGYRAGSSWNNPKLSDFVGKSADSVWQETVLGNIISEIHERLRCLHRDCTQVDLVTRKSDITKWASDLEIDFEAEYLAPMTTEIPETKKILELKKQIKEQSK